MNVTSFCALCVLLVLGKYLRVKVRLFQRLYLPSSVLGGLLGLVLVQLAGRTWPGPGFVESVTYGWRGLPGFLISIVFAALFLGVTIPPVRSIWRKAGPQLAYGQIVAWGQYTVAILLAAGVLAHFVRPGGEPLSPAFGAIIPVGFEGGHGTAGGMAEVFARYGWEAGRDFGLASATVGIVSAIVVGMALVNWAVRRGYVSKLRRVEEMSESGIVGFYPVDERPPAGRQTVSADSIDTLALHLAIIGVAVLIGYFIKEGLQWLEVALSGQSVFFTGFPLFPLAMIGGLLVQLFLSRVPRVNPVDHGLMQRISGTALDFLVVAAVSTIRLSAITEGWLPFVVVICGGILWNVFCLMWLARRLLPDFWFERGIAEMGQSMGVTATGLLLLRVVDPQSETEAPSAFGYKQLLHEPFMGGGLWTASAVPLIYLWGPWAVWLVSLGALAGWLVVWAACFRPRGSA